MVADRLGAAADAGADPDAWAAAYIAALGEGCERDEAMDLADEVAGLRRKRRRHANRYHRADLRRRIAAAAAETHREPSAAQLAAENYRKGRVTVHGLPITIETPRGAVRSGVSKSGRRWSVTMAHHYGYIRLTESEADGDHVDVFIGRHPESELVFVIDQVKPSGRFDEHKCMLGFRSAREARKGYLACYSDDWTGFGGIRPLTLPAFKRWLQTGDTGRPIARQKIRHGRAGAPRRYDTTDREGHAHRGKGPGGGQFVSKGGAGGDRGGDRDEPRFAKPSAKRGAMSGAQRVGKGKEARIVLADGSPAPAHIKPSMVPPDWSDVQISTDPDSDVLVQARDNKGRAKTVYRDDYHMRTAAVKFARVEEAMREMPGMLAQMQRDRGDPAKREQAECAWLMAEQATRPGSESDTGAKVKAYGATTLRAEHVETDEDGTVRLHFIGKEGVEHNHVIHNPELAAMLVARKQSADRRGGKLFATDETKVRDYVAQLDGGGFLSKDLRTVRANMIAIREIHATAPPATEKEYKAAVKAVAERVSHVLGNRPAQALESYINPAVFSSWRAGLKPEQPKPKGKPAKRKAAA